MIKFSFLYELAKSISPIAPSIKAGQKTGILFFNNREKKKLKKIQKRKLVALMNLCEARILLKMRFQFNHTEKQLSMIRLCSYSY